MEQREHGGLGSPQPETQPAAGADRGTAVVIAVYLLANLAYFYVLSAREVAASDLVASSMMGRIFGLRGAAVVSVAAMVSIFAALNGSILSGARVPYAMARDGLFFRSVGKCTRSTGRRESRFSRSTRGPRCWY